MNGKSKKIKRFLAAFLPLGGVAGAVLLRVTVSLWSSLFPPCPFLTITGYACPGCGNTRSLEALLRLDLTASLQMNPAPLCFLLIFLLCYGEILAGAFGREIHFLPRSWIFWTLFGMILALYYLLRNILSFLPFPA